MMTPRIARVLVYPALVFSFICSFVLPSVSLAVTPITPSGLNTTVSAPITLPSGQTQFNITGGTRPGGGSNLFHSFGNFNVPNNNIANFLNNSGLPTSNILGRVTGGNPSNILGSIQTTGFGNANLFLINPAGFLFGPNATVNVGGMMTFTSADYLHSRTMHDSMRFHIDASIAIYQTMDGGYILAGFTDSFGVGGFGIWAVKLNSNGAITWQKVYMASVFDIVNSFKQTGDGGYILAGFTFPPSSTTAMALIIKLDSQGEIVWNKIYREVIEFKFIEQTSDGGYITCGHDYILKLDSGGDVSWGYGYPSAEFDRILETNDGGYIVSGNNGSGYDVLIRKFDSSGNTVWEKAYGGYVFPIGVIERTGILTQDRSGGSRSHLWHPCRPTGRPAASGHQPRSGDSDRTGARRSLRGPMSSERNKPVVRQLSLFTTEIHPAIDLLRRLDVNSLTPLEAISKLYELQRKAQEKAGD